MSELLTPNEIEAKAKSAGLSIADVCKRAGIAQSTFSRWKAGKTKPGIDVYQRVRDAVSPNAEASV